ncbi:transcriptional regulator [Streptomyces alanosinicus]|uniref:Transcriptional regulator n=1 Tax=Streptomyces alanosinicus TaxID=68171 RepID=A0A919D700_9ACTN|nr:transcriptional regulator [Streptomyces alanosinicus]
MPWSLTLSEVGARLEELRKRRDLTQSHVAGVLRDRGIRIDTSGLSRLEQGQRRRVSRDLAEALLDCYDADSTERAEILQLLSADTTPAGRPRPALWRRNAALLGPMQFEGFLKMERRATAILNYERALIPGLFQTPEYARAVIAGMRPELRLAEVKALADVRVDRQRKVADWALQDFRALIDEEALHLDVGDPAVMQVQLERLIEESEKTSQEIRILPDTVGLHPGKAGPFVVMRFPEAARAVVWAETMVSSVYYDGEADVQRYTEAFTNLWERALEPTESRVRLKKMIKELQQ